jgi:hypothetical protein
LTRQRRCRFSQSTQLPWASIAEGSSQTHAGIAAQAPRVSKSAKRLARRSLDLFFQMPPSSAPMERGPWSTSSSHALSPTGARRKAQGRVIAPRDRAGSVDWRT